MSDMLSEQSSKKNAHEPLTPTKHTYLHQQQAPQPQATTIPLPEMGLRLRTVVKTPQCPRTLSRFHKTPIELKCSLKCSSHCIAHKTHPQTVAPLSHHSTSPASMRSCYNNDIRSAVVTFIQNSPTRRRGLLDIQLICCTICQFAQNEWQLALN